MGRILIVLPPNFAAVRLPRYSLYAGSRQRLLSFTLALHSPFDTSDCCVAPSRNSLKILPVCTTLSQRFVIVVFIIAL